jgi:hypothetical protein
VPLLHCRLLTMFWDSAGTDTCSLVALAFGSVDCGAHSTGLAAGTQFGRRQRGLRDRLYPKLASLTDTVGSPPL